MDLVGWDLVFAISVAAVNRALADQHSKLISAFNVAGDVVAQGSYANWTIAPGGSGTIVVLAITIGQGNFQRGTQPVPIGGGVLSLKVELTLLPTATGSHLSFDIGKDTVTFVSLTGVPALGPLEAAALGTALAADLTAHANEITFVLASVSPVGVNGPAWLNPAQLAFSYAVPNGSAPVLGIFAVTTPRDIAHLDRTIDPSVIGPGGVGLAIAPGLFLANVFAPALSAAFNAPAGAIRDTGPFMGIGPIMLRNAVPIGLAPVSRSGETYYPRITALAATLADDRINIVLSGDCDMHMNITMTFSASSSIGVALGSPTALALHTIGQPSFAHDVSIPWYDHLLDIAGGVAEIILDVTVAAISSRLADGIRFEASSGAVVGDAPSIVSWVGGRRFVADSAGLNGAFWLHGAIQ